MVGPGFGCEAPASIAVGERGRPDSTAAQRRAVARACLVSMLLLVILPGSVVAQSVESATGESAQQAGTAVAGTVVARVGDELRIEIDPGQLTPEPGNLVTITWPFGGRVLDAGGAEVTEVSAGAVTARITVGNPNINMDAVIWVTGSEDTKRAGETLDSDTNMEDRGAAAKTLRTRANGEPLGSASGAWVRGLQSVESSASGELILRSTDGRELSFPDSENRLSNSRARAELSVDGTMKNSFVASKHHTSRVYVADVGRLVQLDLHLRSRTFQASTISPDLTRDGGRPVHGAALSAVAEDAVVPNVVWTGSADGAVHVTRDGGRTWTNATPPTMSERSFVNAIAAGTSAGTAFLGGHDLGGGGSHLSVTRDFGESWQLIASWGDETIRVIEVLSGRALRVTTSDAVFSTDDYRREASWRRETAGA